mmetsp:Transcript_54318/g.129099  ORF Transcript_54318/g.129099 Transcript_54318/m.129099 type:complete len:227 (-) Transcript_54318:43-723(-)
MLHMRDVRGSEATAPTRRHRRHPGPLRRTAPNVDLLLRRGRQPHHEPHPPRASAQVRGSAAAGGRGVQVKVGGDAVYRAGRRCLRRLARQVGGGYGGSDDAGKLDEDGRPGGPSGWDGRWLCVVDHAGGDGDGAGAAGNRRWSQDCLASRPLRQPPRPGRVRSGAAGDPPQARMIACFSQLRLLVLVNFIVSVNRPLLLSSSPHLFRAFLLQVAPPPPTYTHTLIG